MNYSAKDVSLQIDKSASIIILQIGEHKVQMTLDEWSRMISCPVVISIPRIIS